MPTDQESISLDSFVESETNLIIRFKSYWLKQRKAEGSENWPSKMSLGDWIEQIECFAERGIWEK